MGSFSAKGIAKPMIARRQVVEMTGSGKRAKLTAKLSMSQGSLKETLCSLHQALEVNCG